MDINLTMRSDVFNNGAKFNEVSQKHSPRIRLPWDTHHSIIKLWVILFGASVNDYGICDISGRGRELVFSSKTSAGAFDEWIIHFKTAFSLDDNLTDTIIPDGPLVGYYVGDIEKYTMSTYLGHTTSGITTDRITILKNCKYPVRRMASNGWLFYDEQDTMMFKLSRK